MIENLIPASANVAKDIRTILESHVLERNKYQWRHPALLSSIPEIEASSEELGLYSSILYRKSEKSPESDRGSEVW